MLRKWLPNLRLRTKAMIVSLSVATLSLSLVAVAGLLQIRREIASEQHRTADSVAKGVARASQLALSVRDTHELTRVANAFLRDENVLFVAIYADSAQPVASASRDRAAWEGYLRGAVDKNRCIVGDDQVEALGQLDEFSNETDNDGVVQRPAKSDQPGERIGRVVVGLSTASTLAAQERQTRVTLIATIVAAVASSVFMFLALGPWMRRLQRLATASEAISRGDFGNPIQDDQSDEIGQLAATFNGMRLALRDRDTKLRDFNQTLQEQVEQRTSELETALAAAEEASRAKSLFLANMSHELRTPLNGVIGMVDLLLSAEPNPQQRRYCDVAKTSARSLLELINDILDFSKIEAGKLEIDQTDFDLHDLIGTIGQMMGERAQKKGLELICRVRDDLPRVVSGDPLRIRQIVLNLMSNAVKFTESGEVELDAAVESQTNTHALIRFTVRDSGIGIPQQRLDRLFKSFSQVDASTTRRFGGSGLGLAISQRLVELMGGSIVVESQEAKGSTFHFTIQFEKRATPIEPVREGRVNPSGLRALAVDDNKTNREILHDQLASWSLMPDVADGARQALTMLRDAALSGQPYRIAILDMHMPETDGVQLARAIKADPTTRDTVLISLSSIGDHLRPQQMNEIGFSACLTKPAIGSHLYDAIVDSLTAREKSDSHSAPAQPSRAFASHLDGVRVLLAEDNEINRMVACELLEQAGCICTVTVNGREAFDAALPDQHDVILMDCQMPEMDGFEATQKIREAESAANTGRHRPIIALTANAIKGDRERCLGAGMDGYVTKPVDPIELFTTIRSLLSPERLAAIPAHAPLAIPDPKPAAPAPTAATPPVDLESLKRRCMGNRRLAAKALSKFESVMAVDVATLIGSLRGGDAKATASSAHKIKGAAANVSAEDVRRVVAEIEHLAKSDALSQVEASIIQLEDEMIRFRTYLSTALDRLAEPVSK